MNINLATDKMSQNVSFGRKHKGPRNNIEKERKNIKEQFDNQINNLYEKAVRNNMNDNEFYDALQYIREQRNQELALLDIFG